MRNWRRRRKKNWPWGGGGSKSMYLSSKRVKWALGLGGVVLLEKKMPFEWRRAYFSKTSRWCAYLACLALSGSLNDWKQTNPRIPMHHFESCAKPPRFLSSSLFFLFFLQLFYYQMLEIYLTFALGVHKCSICLLLQAKRLRRGFWPCNFSNPPAAYRADRRRRYAGKGRA